MENTNNNIFTDTQLYFLQKIYDRYDKDLRQNMLQWKRLVFFN